MGGHTAVGSEPIPGVQVEAGQVEAVDAGQFVIPRLQEGAVAEVDADELAGADADVDAVVDVVRVGGDVGKVDIAADARVGYGAGPRRQGDPVADAQRGEEGVVAVPVVVQHVQVERQAALGGDRVDGAEADADGEPGVPEAVPRLAAGRQEHPHRRADPKPVRPGATASGPMGFPGRARESPAWRRAAAWPSPGVCRDSWGSSARGRRGRESAISASAPPSRAAFWCSVFIMSSCSPVTCYLMGQ